MGMANRNPNDDPHDQEKQNKSQVKAMEQKRKIYWKPTPDHILPHANFGWPRLTHSSSQPKTWFEISVMER